MYQRVKVTLVGVAGGVVSDLDLVVFLDLTEVLFQKVLHLHYLSVVLVHCSVGNHPPISQWCGDGKYSGTSDKGPSEIGKTSLQGTLVSTPC